MNFKHSYTVIFSVISLSLFGLSYRQSENAIIPISYDDTTKNDTSKLKYKLKDYKAWEKRKPQTFDLKDPQVLKNNTQYDPKTNTYTQKTQIGNGTYSSPKILSFEEFQKEQQKKEQSDYFAQKSKATNFVRGSGIIPQLHIGGPEILDKLTGGGLIDIRPSLSAEATFGGIYNMIQNPQIPVRQQRQGSPDFKLKMQANITGQIGNRLKINTNYDTDATFEFENQIKLNWEGEEDDILKKIELGNVNLPLNGSLIQGGSSLFGVKTGLQFGKLTATIIATQQKGQSTETELSGGAQITKFDIQASNYEANKHFFLGQFFKNQYDRALQNLPIVASGAMINYIEVWVTNRTKSFSDIRNIISFMDLGETDPYNNNLNNPGISQQFTDNNANKLFPLIQADPRLNNSATVIDQLKTTYANYNMNFGLDYNLLTNARKLTEQEFTINRQLGYISLNQALNNDEVLAVAYEYSYNGQIFKVGQLSRDNPPINNVGTDLVVKMLKSTLLNTRIPMWDLMMKNIYSLNTYNIQREDFNLNVVYADDKTADLNYLPVPNTEPKIFEKQLISVLNLDKINKQNEAKPDGVFDLIEGVTINAMNGRIIFPVREPFGAFLRGKFADPNSRDANFYSYDALYDSTRWWAEQDATHNKFFIRGTFKGSATNEISIGSINIPQGSVKVTANGAMLTEGVDYIVDYNMGKVRITNEGVLNSGAIIKVSSESNSLFSIQQKTLVGSRFDYKYNRNLILGATVLHMKETPLTPKVNIGEEPLLNTIVGFDGSWNKESRLLTKLVDKLPFIETKEKSTLSFQGEFAKIFPHNAKTMGARGTSYLDDFEGAESQFDLKYANNWKLASTPQGQPMLFPESILDSNKNIKRAKLDWHFIDPVLINKQQNTPSHITGEDQSHPYVRLWSQLEVFPKLNLQISSPQQLTTLDLVFRPNKRGMYNYNTSSNDFDANGLFKNPKSTWGGITRRMETNDFEAANFDYIEFWMMDPFVLDKNSSNRGSLYINLGSVSEDVCGDNRRSVENGIPSDGSTIGLDNTRSGRVASVPPTNNAFSTNSQELKVQDVGFDGLNDDDERLYFSTYLQQLKDNFGASSIIYNQALNDPSGDNYKYYLEPDYANNNASILSRYMQYNGLEGNSSLDKLNNQIPKQATNLPDDEDINRDQTLSINEEYFQYKIDLSKNSLKVGQNFVTDSSISVPNYIDQGPFPSNVTWYQFKIPIRQFTSKVGDIQDFKSIRFMRMFLQGFEDSIVCRFGQLHLVRADWRRYLKDLKFPPNVGPNLDPNDETEFIISTVNIEKNSNRVPVIYDLPPGFSRELDPTQPGDVKQNEQSLSLRACRLKKGDSRAAYKTLNFDIRNYKTLKMFIHAEGDNLDNGDVRAFVRIGTDLERNYYQYEIPLSITPHGTSDPTSIWPLQNELSLDLEEFYAIKLNRQNAISDPTGYYEQTLANGHKISIIGQPDLSNVRTVMLGVNNPNDVNNGKKEICTEVWFNELRLEDFVNKGGYAANARFVAQFADFAKLNVTGSYQSIGFGGIDKKLNQRNINESIQWDIQTSMELGKFFNKKFGVTIPMYIGYNQNILNPKYNPLNPDILLTTALKAAQSEAEKSALKQAAQDFTSRYSVNFTNVKKNKVGGGKSHVYDLENFNFSYSYLKYFRRSQIIEENLIRTYKASVGYNFSVSPYIWEPLKKIIKNKNLTIIKDINLSFMPSSINILMSVNRNYGELQNRNNDGFKAIVPRFYDKTFLFSRQYAFNYAPMRNLKIDYNSIMNARVEEPQNALDTELKKDTMWRNFKNLGTPNDFNQTVNATYTLPLNKIKMLNWATLSGRYSTSYNWQSAPPAASTLGNSIQNSQTMSVNGNFNFTQLYNKNKYLKKANSNTPLPKKSKKKLISDDPEEPTPAKPAKKDIELSLATKSILKLITLVKQVQVDFSTTNGIALPGFIKKPEYFGNNIESNAPGWRFILGDQNPNLRYDLAKRGMMSTDTNIITRYTKLAGNDFKASATLEPLTGFRINMIWERRFSNSVSSNFKYNSLIDQFEDFSLLDAGTFSIGIISWKTAFEKINRKTFQSDGFDNMKNNRLQIAKRLQETEFNKRGAQYVNKIGDKDTTIYPVGFLGTQADVLYYSFLSAYTGKSANTFDLSRFPKIPMPSWRINYNGLTNIPFFKKYFSNINISHAYSSTFSVGAFNSNLNYQRANFDTLTVGKSLESEYNFATISIIERITPLIGIDLTTQKGLTLKFEIRTDRNLTLAAQGFQVIEIKNKEFVIGSGYRASGIKMPFKISGKRVILQNDLNFRFDFSIRDGITISRGIETTLTPQATSGLKTYSIRPQLDYNISDNLNFRAFYNRTLNNPYTQSSYKSSLTTFGISLRYTMQ